jgi:hypothetical protein
MKSVIALCLATLIAATALAKDPPKIETDPETGCPINLSFLEPKLETVTADGRLYTYHRQTIGIPIDKMIETLGGEEKAMAIAHATSEILKKKFADDEYMTNAERRFNKDTILINDAFMATLKCRESRNRT